MVVLGLRRQECSAQPRHAVPSYDLFNRVIEVGDCAGGSAVHDARAVPSFGVWSPEGEAKDARYHDWRVLKGRVVLGINHRLGLSLKAPRSGRRPWLSSCSHWSHRFEARAGFDPLTLPWRNCSPVPSW